MLAAAGMEVRVVATTSSEAASTFDSKACLAELGIRIQTFAARVAGRTRPELEFVSRGISYRLWIQGTAGRSPGSRF
ncbi:MAG: hypothetical protein JWN34_1757 [Bryobacterales bacterium]|nr:hypothetical protein [Bryobacterales bacterium]